MSIWRPAGVSSTTVDDAEDAVFTSTTTEEMPSDLVDTEWPLRVSSRQQVHGHSLENQLFAMEAGHRAKYTMYVEAYTMVSRRL